MTAEGFDTPIQSVLMLVSGIVYSKPCLLWGATLRGTPGETCTLSIFDGQSTSGIFRFTLGSVAEGFTSVTFPRPIAMISGLYAYMGAAASRAILLFVPQPET